MDGVLYPLWEVHCVLCETPALGLGRTKGEAQKELRNTGWQVVNNRWHCNVCKRLAAPPKGESNG